MLQVEVAQEVVCDVVRVTAREGCTDGADHLLTGVCMKTRYVLLNTLSTLSVISLTAGLYLLAMLLL